MSNSTGRRDFLKTVGKMSVLAAAISAGVFNVPDALAQSPWNRTAFDSKDYSEALKNLGASGASESDKIKVSAPDIAENGAVVPIDVVSEIPNTISIAVLAENNPLPLISAWDYLNGALPILAVRAKLGKTGDVYAVVKTADGKYYTAKKEVKVTVGGCGG